MSTLALRGYRVGDERLFVARPDFAALFALEGRLPDGPKYTLHDGAATFGVGGLEPLGDRHWGAWAYAADLSARQWTLTARLAGGLLAYSLPMFGAKCIQAVAEDCPGAPALLTRMGFKAFDRQTDDGRQIFCMFGDV